MKLQISFDLTNLDEALEIAKKVEPFADILEVGTVLIFQHGVNAVEQFKKTFPQKTILADAKIVDRGKEVVTQFSKASADWITVMAGTRKAVVHTACTTANDLGKKIMLDLLDSDSVGQSALEAKTLGAHALLFHQPYDEQEPLDFLDKWDMIKGNSELPIFVSAKINRENIERVLSVQPNGIVIGRSIVRAQDPALEAEFFYNQIHKTS